MKEVTIRDTEGIMYTRLYGDSATFFISEVINDTITKRFKSGTKYHQFENDNNVFVVKNPLTRNEEIRIYLWKGCYFTVKEI